MGFENWTFLLSSHKIHHRGKKKKKKKEAPQRSDLELRVTQIPSQTPALSLLMTLNVSIAWKYGSPSGDSYLKVQDHNQTWRL